MLRSNHLQPGINLNPISFPSADLTLKVFSNKRQGDPIQGIRGFKPSVFFHRWNQHEKHGKTLSPSPSRGPQSEVLQVLSPPAALALPVV